MRVEWSPLAKADLASIVDTIRQDSPRAAARLVFRINQRVTKLRQFPQLGPVSGRRADLRQRTITGTPYVVLYKVADSVRIIAVMHAHRDF